MNACTHFALPSSMVDSFINSKMVEYGIQDQQFTQIITNQTKSEEIDRVAEEVFNSYEEMFRFCDDSGTLLAVACSKGNFGLVRHLINKDSESEEPQTIVNLGDLFGVTPLACLAKSSLEENLSIDIAKFLIEKGANINLATALQSCDKDTGLNLPEKATPLWIALEKENKGIADLLCRKKAVIHPLLSEKAKIFFRNLPIIKEKLTFLCIIKKGGSFKNLPQGVFKIIFKFLEE